MKIIKGETRIVFVFKNFVIKLPVIAFKNIFLVLKSELKYLVKELRRNGLKKYYQKRLTNKTESDLLNQQCTSERSEKFGLVMPLYKRYEMHGSISNCLLAGIMANWNEFTFYSRSNNPFLMPTYFSLFGLLNLQKKAEPIFFWTYVDVWLYVCRNSQNMNQPFCSSHTFAAIENFGLDGDYLKIIDYGNRHTNHFLEVNGENLFNNFVKPPV